MGVFGKCFVWFIGGVRIVRFFYVLKIFYIEIGVKGVVFVGKNNGVNVGVLCEFVFGFDEVCKYCII